MKRFCIISLFLQQFSSLILFILAASISVGFISPGHVSAQGNVTLFGTVKDNTGTSFPGTEIQAINPSTHAVVGSVVTDSNGMG